MRLVKGLVLVDLYFGLLFLHSSSAIVYSMYHLEMFSFLCTDDGTRLGRYSMVTVEERLYL